MIEEPVLVLFCGGVGGSAIEDDFAVALRQCSLDTLTEAHATGAFASIVLAVDESSARYFEGRLPPGVQIDVDRPGEAFHFGRRLSDVVRRYGLQRPVYIGSGMPLIKGDELAAVAHVLSLSESAVVANNFFSADFLGFVPGSAVDQLELPDNDRALPRLLSQELGLENKALPRTMGNQFDIDTPGDLAVLWCAGGAGSNLQRWLDASSLETSHLQRAARLFTDREAEVLVAGRISTDVLHYLQSETASRTRLYSEERGMQAMGRDVSGEARTLLAYHLQAVGIERFFAQLPTLAHGAFIDTRPIFAHLGLQPSRPDRFLSDALQPEGISDPWIREFTAAARDAAIPVVLGGQSLVTSGLQLLAEAAWRQRDQEQADYKARGRATT